MKNKNKITRKATGRSAKPKFRESKMFDIPTYAQTEEFTSSAACSMMALKYLNKNLRMRKELEFEIWQEAVHGSVWQGSRYGIAYALPKRPGKKKFLLNISRPKPKKKRWPRPLLKM